MKTDDGAGWGRGVAGARGRDTRRAAGMEGPPPRRASPGIR